MALKEYLDQLYCFGYKPENVKCKAIEPGHIGAVKRAMNDLGYEIDDRGDPALVIVDDVFGIWKDNGWHGIYVTEHHVICFPSEVIGMSFELAHELTHAYQPLTTVLSAPISNMNSKDPQIRKKAMNEWLMTSSSDYLVSPLCCKQQTIRTG